MKTAVSTSILILTFALLSAGCASTGGVGHVDSNSPILMAPGVTPLMERPALTKLGEQAFLVRYGRKDALISRNIGTGAEAEISKESPPGAKLNGLATYADGKRLNVAWRPKLVQDVAGLGTTGSKYIYAASSSDGVAFTDTQRLSNGGGAFPALLSGNGEGDVYALWQDERAGVRYDLYFNVSHDGGRSWKEKETRIDPGLEGDAFSAEPTIVAEGNFVWVTWQEAGRVNDELIRKVYVRTSDDRGETWQDPVVVATPKLQALYPQLVRTAKRLHVYWYDEQGIKGSVSLNNGQTWERMEDIQGPGVMQEMQAVADSKGTVHLLFASRSPDTETRANVFYTRSPDGTRFTPMTRLNGGPEFESTAFLAFMDFDQMGNALAAWVDYRYFRPVIMGRTSLDGGLTWNSEKILSNGQAERIEQLPMVMGKDKGFWLSYLQYDNELQTQGYAIVKQIDVDDVSPGLSPTAADMTKLESRVMEWWDSRIVADWGKSYDLMDPFMRVRTEKPKYVSSQGSVKYYAAKVVKTEKLSERRARVTVKFTSEVPKLEIYGRTISVPKKEEETTQEWIWVDGDWFFLFKDMYGKNFLDY